MYGNYVFPIHTTRITGIVDWPHYIDNEWSSVQIMAWRQSSKKPFIETMMTVFINMYIFHQMVAILFRTQGVDCHIVMRCNLCENMNPPIEKEPMSCQHPGISWTLFVYSSLPGQNGCYFADDIFKCIFFNENVWIAIRISLKFVTKGPIHNIPALVQITACHRPGDKPLSEPMMVRLPTHICVTRPQCVNGCNVIYVYDSCNTIVILGSAWLLLMTWCLFGARASAITMLMQANHHIYYISGAPQCNAIRNFE